MYEKLAALWSKFRSRRYREAFVASHLSTTIAAQISTMREARAWTQTDLAAAANMRQSRISVLEDPSNRSLSVKTLQRIAAAFDVAVIVRFVPYSEVARWATDSGPKKFEVPEFKDDKISDSRPIQLSAVTPSRIDGVQRWFGGSTQTFSFSAVAVDTNVVPPQSQYNVQ